MHRVLIVEDERNIASSWQEQLRDEGYEVEVAEDGEAGWQRWQAAPYDVVILDLKMPRLSGGALLTRIRECQPWVPVVIVSGEGTEQDKLRAVNQHAYAYLEKKDVTIGAIKATLERALADRHLALRVLESLVEHSPDPDQPLLAVGAESYSAQRLFDEARMGTELGRGYVRDLAQTIVEGETMALEGMVEEAP